MSVLTLTARPGVSRPGLMPRRASTCLTTGVAAADMCRACLNPKLKASCERARAPTESGAEQPVLPPQQPEQPRSYPRTWVTVDAGSDVGSDGDKHDDGAHEHRFSHDVSDPPATDATTAYRASTSSERESKQPMRYEPNDFWRCEVPAEAREMRTQLQRTAELRAERKKAVDVLLAEWLQAAHLVVMELKRRLTHLSDELGKSRQACKHAESALRKEECQKRQKTLKMFFTMEQPKTQPRGPPAELGQGYTARNITSRTFAHHVTAIETSIIELSNGDPLKQLQLAVAVNQRMQGIRELRDKDQEAWGYVRNSLKAFFEKLQDRYHGRYPNHIRAAQQAVCAAIANAAPPRKLHVISEATGASLDRLSEGRKHWSQWVSGDRESIMDLRGKIRSDGMPEEWVEFAIAIWKSETRASERAKDSLRNPNDKCAPCLSHLPSVLCHPPPSLCCIMVSLPLPLLHQV